MKRIGFGLLLGLTFVPVNAFAAADELTQYVQSCKQDLGIIGSIPALNCNNGDRFDIGGPGSFVNDFVGYKWLSSYVDLVFACRWMSDASGDFKGAGPFVAAASVELLIHNRQSGHTCFFAARDTKGNSTNGVLTAITPPDALLASDYWLTPSELNSLVPNPGNDDAGHESTFRCVGCHAAGPYIASPKITRYLAKNGLLNDGHDISNIRYSAFSNGPGGWAFSNWNTIKNNKLLGSSCASTCHALGASDSSVAKLNTAIITARQVLIPALYNDIAAVNSANLMPIDNGTIGDFSSADYRWMNIDIPDDPATTGDVELFYPLKSNQLGLGARLSQSLTCETEPLSMEARVVGSNAVQRTTEPMFPGTIPDVLEKFDQTGLICRNASQPSGKCANYTVRFNCVPPKFTLSSQLSGKVLTISNPDANNVRSARGQSLNGSWVNSSQLWTLSGVNDGVHFNYVRLNNPWITVSLNADPTGVVTVAGQNADWLSEQWVMEYVGGTPYVRFRNLWKAGKYLTMDNNSDFSSVSLQDLRTDAAGLHAQNWQVNQIF